MKLAIFGATGKTGGHALRHAIAAGHEVIALARNPATLAPIVATNPTAKIMVLAGDATRQADCEKVLAGCDAVIAALGPQGLGTTTLRQDAARAITAAMTAQGVKRIVWLSAFGVGDNIAQAKRTSWIAPLFMKTLLKRTYVDANAAEHVLRDSGLDYVLCRPPELTNKAARGGVVEVPEDQKVPKLRIPREDVAIWMLKAATTGTFDLQAVTIC